MFKEKLLATCISLYIFVCQFRLVLIHFKNHNGISLFNYPEKKWNLVPFPLQKGDIFNADNLATVNRHEFLNDGNFIKARNAAESRWGFQKKVRDISWRLHVILWAFGLALQNRKMNGSIFVECGTGRGYMAAGIAEFHHLNDKSPLFYLIDTFTPDLVLTTGESISSPAHFAYSDDDAEVKQYFKRYSNIKIIKGLIPEVLNQLPKSPIGFLHIDLNNADAESAALQYLMGRLVSGSVIVFDDYGGVGGNEQAIVHEKFASLAHKNLLVLPTGQAVLIW
jgi:O-methyltransferase